MRRAAAAALAVAIVALLLWWRGGSAPADPAPADPAPAPAARPDAPSDLSSDATDAGTEATGAPGPRGAAARDVRAEPDPRTRARAEDASRDPASARRDAPSDVEDLKRRIYALEIDSIEHVHRLDALVDTGDASPEDLWGGEGWNGVDDWKREPNGFALEMQPDGTLLFFPDEETTRLYSFFESIETYEYDEQRGEFVNEVDYYGKRIFNVVKFLRDDVLVLMTISGPKVDLNVYQRTPGQHEADSESSY